MAIRLLTEVSHFLARTSGALNRMRFGKKQRKQNAHGPRARDRAPDAPKQMREAGFMNNVNHPTHYNSGKIEVIEALEDWGLNFHRANAVKYIARAGKKDPSKECEDLEKAIWYLRRNIELIRAKENNSVPIKPNDMNVRDE